MTRDDDIERAARTLRQGGLVALPTETVYGLGADAENELAVRRIFAVKGRPSSHPLIVHVESLEAAQSWASEISPAGVLLARAFWPGPLTIIVPKSSRASEAVTGGQPTVGLRVPSHPAALALLQRFGGGIAAPSANRFGSLSPTTADHVRLELGAEVDFILDGGPCSVGVESTIVDVAIGAPRILRPGGISREQLERALGMAVPVQSSASDVRAPGMLESHYAPRAGLVLLSAAEVGEQARQRAASGQRVVVLAPEHVFVPPAVMHLTVPSDVAEFARVLFTCLREADAMGDVILAVPPAESGLGLAVRDRLKRGAAPRLPPNGE